MVGGGNLQILAVHNGSRYERPQHLSLTTTHRTRRGFQLRFSALRVLQMASADALRMPPQISRFLLLVAFLLKPAPPLYWRFSGGMMYRNRLESCLPRLLSPPRIVFISLLQHMLSTNKLIGYWKLIPVRGRIGWLKLGTVMRGIKE